LHLGAGIAYFGIYFEKKHMLKNTILGMLMLGCAAQLLAQKPIGVYYVGANAGLNLRATPASNGERLATPQYADKVEITQPAPDQSMTVDGIPGGMAQVKVDGKVGYMFDGYLVRHIMPTKGEQVDVYVGRLWSSEADVLHEEHRKDYGGYATMEYAIHFKEMPWSEAFLIAKNLYGIPAPLQFLGDKGIDHKIAKNPNPSAGAWTDELDAEFDHAGRIVSITYSHRGEGGGTVIRVEKSTEDGYALKLYELDIAD
jgi:hypothetical protein